MFNVCVLFVVRALVSDTGRHTVRMCKIRAQSLQKITKMEDLLKTWVSFQKSFEDSRLEKNQKFSFGIGEQATGTQRLEINKKRRALQLQLKKSLENFGKTFILKLSDFLQDSS